MRVGERGEMPRIPIPQELVSTAILTSTAPDYGLTTARLRGPDVDHPHWGVSAVGLDLAFIDSRCLALLPAMEPGQAFSHTTALALHGARLPRFDPDLHVSVRFPRTPPRRPGVSGHSLTENPVMLLRGMPVAPAAVAWAQSAVLLSREDVVAVADGLVTGRRRGFGHELGLCTIEELIALAAAWRGRPGAARLAWAAPQVRVGVDSRPETLLRLLLVRSRLPEPVVNHPVTVRGGLVLHPDLAYPDRRLALEYEGRDHLTDPEVAEIDLERRELLAEVRWRTIRVTAPQLFGHPTALVARVRRQLRA
jgi:very-short-patch-repair endonuclease